jgi:hypothetical protein
MRGYGYVLPSSFGKGFRGSFVAAKPTGKGENVTGPRKFAAVHIPKSSMASALEKPGLDGLSCNSKGSSASLSLEECAAGCLDRLFVIVQSFFLAFENATALYSLIPIRAPSLPTGVSSMDILCSSKYWSVAFLLPFQLP